MLNHFDHERHVKQMINRQLVESRKYVLVYTGLSVIGLVRRTGFDSIMLFRLTNVVYNAEQMP